MPYKITITSIEPATDGREYELCKVIYEQTLPELDVNAVVIKANEQILPER